jgi:hypothetical protein
MFLSGELAQQARDDGQLHDQRGCEACADARDLLHDHRFRQPGRPRRVVGVLRSEQPDLAEPFDHDAREPLVPLRIVDERRELDFGEAADGFAEVVELDGEVGVGHTGRNLRSVISSSTRS